MRSVVNSFGRIGRVVEEYRRGGELGTCESWNGQIWCGENLAPLIECHWHHLNATLIQNSQVVAHEQAWTVNVGCYFRWALGWLLLFLGFSTLAVFSWPLLDARCCFGPSNTVA